MKPKININYQIKDFVLIGILNAIIFVLDIAIWGLIVMSPIFSIYAPGISAFVTGTIVFFLIVKVPKFGIFTFIACMKVVFYTLMGTGYLPTLILLIISGLIADIIAIPSQYKKTLILAIGNGICSLAVTLSPILSVMFLNDYYIKYFNNLNVPQEKVNQSLYEAGSLVAVSAIFIGFLGGFLGIYIGKKLLNKHFKKAGII